MNAAKKRRSKVCTPLRARVAALIANEPAIPSAVIASQIKSVFRGRT